MAMDARIATIATVIMISISVNPLPLVGLAAVIDLIETDLWIADNGNMDEILKKADSNRAKLSSTVRS